MTLLLVAAQALAEEEEEKEADFWPSIVDPGRKEFEDALERGVDLMDKARRVPEPLRTKILEDALAAFKAATGHSPGNYRGWYFLGRTLSSLGRDKQALAAFKRVRSLDPDDKEVRYGVGFELGIALSKAGEFEKAVLEYDRADRALAGGLRGRDTRGTRSIVHGNAAEALMALGRLDEAIQRYRESLSYNPANTLVRYGLAVAYDRDEQVSKAQQEMRTALAGDNGMRLLTSDDVFFIPEGDVHYYYALGYLTKGSLDQAKQQWQLFLQKLPNSQWASRARAHLAALGVASGGEKRRHGRLAPVPKPISGQQKAGARDRAAVRSRLAGYLYRIRSCYRTELRKQPGLTGQLRIAFTVKRNGRADKVRVVRSTLKRPALHRCVINAVKRIYFSRPISGRSVRVEYPIQFKP